MALVGATATGKTAVGLALAERHGMEVVCADSRQVYADLEQGTGKPAPAERGRVPHHLFDALSLDQRASAGWYGRACDRVRRDIQGRGSTPLLVGGSGLYLRAAMHGLSGEPPHDPAVRERIRAQMAEQGPESLHARLVEVDPATASRLAPRDRQRIGRALEVWEASGRPLSWWQGRASQPHREERWQVVELTLDPGALRARVQARTRVMFEQGLLAEVAGLMARGLEAPLRKLRAVGYDEALDLLAGGITRAEAEERTITRTVQLAKRQRTWFRHQVSAHRVDASDLECAAQTIEGLWGR